MAAVAAAVLVHGICDSVGLGAGAMMPNGGGGGGGGAACGGSGGGGGPGPDSGPPLMVLMAGVVSTAEETGVGAAGDIVAEAGVVPGGRCGWMAGL